MRLTVIAVGENKVNYLSEGEADYLKRLAHYCKVEIHCVKDEKVKGGRSPERIRESEGDRLMRQIPKSGTVVALDHHGRIFSSEQLARQIATWQNRGIHQAVFLIGGPLGLSDDVLSRADLVLSLSKMTYTHEMVRLILLEQLYRSYTILRGEKYHK